MGPSAATKREEETGDRGGLQPSAHSTTQADGRARTAASGTTHTAPVSSWSLCLRRPNSAQELGSELTGDACCGADTVNEACKQNEEMQREVARVKDEWTQEKLKHGRTKQSYQKAMEQQNNSAVARLQPARIAPLPLSPLQSPTGAPMQPRYVAARDVQAGQYALPPLPPPPPTTASPYMNDIGWGSGSHGSLEYGRDGNNRPVHSNTATVASFYPLHTTANMPTHMESGQQHVDPRRRQLPMHTLSQSQTNRAVLPSNSTEQQRYQWERQVHRAGSGPSGGKQPQHSQVQHSGKKRRLSHTHTHTHTHTQSHTHTHTHTHTITVHQHASRSAALRSLLFDTAGLICVCGRLVVRVHALPAVQQDSKASSWLKTHSCTDGATERRGERTVSSAHALC